MKPTVIEAQFLGMIYNILKSTAFNIGMMILGFVIGVGSIVFHYHYVSLRNSNTEFIHKIEQKLDDFEVMDKAYTDKQNEIRELLKEIRIKFMVEESNIKIPKQK